MNTQLKQKIIGIVVVVIFIAIAIPFLLSGHKNKQPGNSSALPTSTETLQLPVSDQQQDLKQTNLLTDTPLTIKNSTDTTNNSVTDQPVPQPAATIPTVTKPVTIKPSVSSTPATTTAVVTAPAVAKPKVTAHSIDTPASQQNPALQASLAQKEKAITNNVSHKKIRKHKTNMARTVTSNHKTSKSTTPKNKSVTKIHDVKKQWVVRLGAYTNKAKAQYILKKLRADNYHATIQIIKIKGKTAHRIILQPLPNKKKATTLAKKVERIFGLKANVVEEQIITTKKPTSHKKR